MINKDKLHIKIIDWVHRTCNKISAITFYYMHLEGSYRTFEKQRETLEDIREIVFDEVCKNCPTYGCNKCVYQDILNAIAQVR